MKRRHTLLLITLLLLFITVQLSEPPPKGSSYLTKGSGTRALFLLLKEEGLSVRPWLLPTAQLEKAEQDALMFVITPQKDVNWGALRSWAEQGNSVVYLSDGIGLESELGVLGLKFPKESNSTQSLVDLITRDARESMPISCQSNFLAQCQGVFTLSQGNLLEPELGSPFHPVIRSEGKSPLLHATLKNGEFWLFLSSEYAQNDFIDLFDNLRLLYQIASKHRVIYLDEFHHGFTAPASHVKKLQVKSLKLLAAVVIIILVIGALSRAVRFGKPLPHLGKDIAGSSEFTTALGLLYHEHSAHGALSHFPRAWKERLAQQTSVNAQLDDESFVRELAYRSAIPYEHLDAVIQSLTKLRFASTVSEEEAHHCVSILLNATEERA